MPKWVDILNTKTGNKWLKQRIKQPKNTIPKITH